MSRLPIPIIGDTATGEFISTGDAGPILAEPFSAFANLAAGGPGRKILLVEMGFSGFIVGQLPFRYASHHFTTRPDDPAYSGFSQNQYFQPRVTGSGGTPGAGGSGSFQIKRSLINGNLLRGKSVPDTCTLTLINVDGKAGGGPNGYPITVRIASDGWYLSDAKTIFEGLIDQVTPQQDNKTLTVTSLSLDRALQNPIQSQLYRGMGYGVTLSSAPNSHVRFPFAGGFNCTTSLAVELYVQFTNIQAYGLITRGLSGSGLCEMLLNANGTVTFQVRDNGGTWHSATSSLASPLVQGTDYGIAGKWDGAHIQVYINGVASGSAVAAAFVPWVDTTDFYIGCTGGADAINGIINETRMWVDVVRTDSQILTNSLQPLASDDTLGLALYAQFEERSGTSTYDNIHFYQGLLEGTGITWAPSFTGTADMLGKSIPTSWGFVWHRDAVLIDPTNNIYQAHHRAILSWDGVFTGGHKLTPLLNFTAQDLRYDHASNRIYLNAFGGNVAIRGFHNFWPFAVGQTVTLGGASSQPGDYVVADVDEEFGLWMQFTAATPLTTATDIALNVTIGTKAGTHEYVGSPATGTFKLIATPNEPVSCRLRGDAPATSGWLSGWVYTAPDIIARIATDMMNVAPSTIAATYTQLAATYPYVAEYATSTNPENADQIFSKLAVSIGANWGYTSDTAQLDLVVFSPPPSNPDTTTNYLPLTKGELIATYTQQEQQVQPCNSSTAQYRHNFFKMTWDQLSGQLQADQSASGILWKQYLLRDFLDATYAPTPSVIVPDGLNPIAQAQDSFDCYLVYYNNAYAVAESQYVLYGVEREIYQVVVKLQPYLFDWRRLVVNLTHPLWPTLVNGKNFKVVSLQGERTRTTMEIWG